jgi:hypothetical protein
MSTNFMKEDGVVCYLSLFHRKLSLDYYECKNHHHHREMDHPRAHTVRRPSLVRMHYEYQIQYDTACILSTNYERMETGDGGIFLHPMFEYFITFPCNKAKKKASNPQPFDFRFSIHNHVVNHHHRDEMKPQSTPPLHILRGLLRQLRPPESGAASSSAGASAAARQYVIAQYRATQSTQGAEKADELRALAFEYYALKRDIAARSKLHLLDTGAEEQLSPKELSRRAAARAGWQLPKLNPDL